MFQKKISDIGTLRGQKILDFFEKKSIFLTWLLIQHHIKEARSGRNFCRTPNFSTSTIFGLSCKKIMSKTFLGKKLCLGAKVGSKLGVTFWQSFNLDFHSSYEKYYKGVYTGVKTIKKCTHLVDILLIFDDPTAFCQDSGHVKTFKNEEIG